jgi:uncharacterized protein
MRRLHLVAPIVLALAAAGLPALPAGAQTPAAPSPEALQAAKDLFALLSKDMIAQLVHQVTAQVWPPIERQLAAKADAATIAELRNQFERIQRENIGDVLAGAPEIYARHFTAAELRQLLDFNRSPLGQKSLHEMPEIMGEVTAMLIPRMRDVQLRTRDAFIKTLQAHGIQIEL